jgi:hypothetical protein
MSQQNSQPNFKSVDEAKKFYADMKFEISSEGYKVYNKQITEPTVQCAFCSKTIESNSIFGIKVNDNEKKSQVITSICRDHAEIMKDLPNKNIELAEIQQMIRFLFPDSGDTIIRKMFMARDLNEHDPIYLEYWALLKWTVEELLLMAITDSKRPEETPAYTRCIANDKCVICGDTNEKRFQLFSPIKQCWMELEVCSKCEFNLKNEIRDLTYEIRTMYFEEYDTIDKLPKRIALDHLTAGIKNNLYKVIFLKPRIALDHTHNILSIVGIDKDHSLLLKPDVENVDRDNAQPKTIEDTPKEE